MKSAIRRVFCALATANVLAAGAMPANAAYPEQPIRLIVSWPPGGSADLVGRELAAALAAGLHGTVLVENPDGASGTIGASTVVRSKPDGYTLYLATSSTNAAAPALLKKLPYDPVADLTPISLVAAAPSMLIVSAQSPYKSVDDLVRAARGKPGSMSFGSGGTGNSGHLSGVLFTSAYHLQATHIPYKGNSPATVDLLGGRIDFMFDNNPVALVKSGKLRALASTGDARSAVLPDVPTFKELGMPAVELSTWFGLAGPKGMPADLVQKINTAVVEGMKQTGAAQRLASQSIDVRTQTPARFQAYWLEELKRYRDLIRISGASAE